MMSPCIHNMVPPLQTEKCLVTSQIVTEAPQKLMNLQTVTMATKLFYHVVRGDITSHASHLLKTLLTYIIPLLVFTNILGPLAGLQLLP